MSENIDYAEMLEIPVSTLNVTKKRSRKKREPAELKEQVVESVNERLEPSSEVTENFTDYGQPRVVQETALPRKRFLESGLLVAEFVAVCVLCAAIVLTNLLWENSAINTFFRGLVQEETPVAAQDDRSYSELTLRSSCPTRPSSVPPTKTACSLSRANAACTLPAQAPCRRCMKGKTGTVSRSRTPRPFPPSSRG